MKEETTIQVFGREMKVELEGLTPMEVAALAEQVSEKMREMQTLSGTADSSKLAMLACLHFAADLSSARDQLEAVRQVDERRLDAMVESLRVALRDHV